MPRFLRDSLHPVRDLPLALLAKAQSSQSGVRQKAKQSRSCGPRLSLGLKALQTQNLARPPIAAACEPLDDFGNVSPTGLLAAISVHRESYIRGNNNKKKINQADFPAEAPVSSSDKYEGGNAKHSLHDLSSASPREFSLTGISESCDRAKNDGGANQAEKHSAQKVLQKNLSFSAPAKLTG